MNEQTTEQIMKGRTVISVDEKLDSEGHVDRLTIGLDDGGIVVISELVLDKQ